MKLKTLKLFLVLCLFNSALFSQIIISSEVGNIISTCSQPIPVSICIENESSYPIENELIKIKMDEGLEYISGSLLSSKVKENSTTGNLNFSLEKLDVCQKHCFSFYIKYNCNDYTGERKISSSITILNKEYETSCYTFAFSSSVGINNIQLEYDEKTNTFYRIMQISNDGAVKIPEFKINTLGNDYITVINSDKGTLSDAGNSLFFDSGDISGIGNRDINFDPGEFINVKQVIKLDECVDNVQFLFNVTIYCKDQICTHQIKVIQDIRINFGTPQLENELYNKVKSNLCDTIYYYGKVFLKNNSINSTISNAYNLDFNFGFLNQIASNLPSYYLNDNCIVLHDIYIGNQRIKLIKNNQFYKFAFSQFTSDPDGISGLSDLDSDGQFDDIKTSDTLFYRITSTIDQTCLNTNCNENYIFPLHYFDADYKYENFCKEPFIYDATKKPVLYRDNTVISIPRFQLYAYSSLSNLHSRSIRKDTLIANIANFNRSDMTKICPNALFELIITLPKIIQRNSNEPIYSKYGTVTNSKDSGNIIRFTLQGNDSVFIPVNILCFPNETKRYVNDSTACTMCVTYTSPIYYIYTKAKFKCESSCGNWIPLNCESAQRVETICDSSRLTTIEGLNGSLQYGMIELKRLSLGHTDSTMQIVSDPKKENLNTAAVSELDTIELSIPLYSLCNLEKIKNLNLTINAFYLKQNSVTPVYYYFPFKFIDQKIYYYKNASSPVFNKNVALNQTNDIMVPNGESYKEYQFSRDDIMNNTPFSSLEANELDSIVVKIYAVIQKTNSNLFSGLDIGFRFFLNYSQGNCFFKKLNYKSITFISGVIYIGGLAMPNMKSNKAILEPQSLVTFPTYISNSFMYSYPINISDYYPNEYRVPSMYNSIKYTLPDYIQAKDTSILESVTFNRFAQNTLSYKKTNNNSNNILEVSDVLKNIDYLIAFYFLKSYVQFQCYTDVLDSIVAFNRILSYANKPSSDQRDSMIRSSLVYKLPGLQLLPLQRKIYHFNDSISQWNFEVSSPLMSNSSQILSNYYKFYNTWIYVENLSGLNVPKELQSIDPIGQIKIYSPIQVTGRNAWFYQIDSLQGRYRFSLSSLIKNCQPDSLKIIIGNSCTGYPKSLDSIPKSCVINAPKTTLYIDPKEAILRIEKLNNEKEIYFTKCDTFSQTIKISNLGFGHAANIRINFNIPVGVNLNLCELRFPFGITASKKIPIQYDPVNANYYTEVPNSEFGKNFAGIFTEDSSRFELKLSYKVDCSLENGSVVNAMIVYNNMCGSQSISANFESPKLFFTKSIPQKEYDLNFEIEKSNSCVDSFKLLINLNKLSNDLRSGDRFVITFDRILFANDILNIKGSNFKLQAPIHKIYEDTELLIFELKDNLQKGEQATLELSLKALCNSNCFETDLKFSIESLYEIECSSAPTGKCEKYVTVQDWEFNDLAVYPKIEFKNINIKYTSLSNQSQFINLDVTLANYSKVNLNQLIQISVFHDSNLNGALDNGDQKLQKLSKSLYFKSDSSSNFIDSFSVSFLNSCPLIFLLSREENPCLCFSDTLYYINATKPITISDYKICEHDSLVIQYSKPDISGVKIDWMPSPFISIISDSSLLFYNSDTLTTNKEIICLKYKYGISDQCALTDSIQIEIQGLRPKLNILSPLKCYGDDNAEIELTDLFANFPLKIDWTQKPSEHNPILKNLTAGWYHVLVSNALGCTIKDSILIDSVPELKMQTEILTNFNNYNVSCFGSNDAKIKIDYSGNQGKLSYRVNGKLASPPFNNFSAGRFILEIMDENNCLTVDTVFITEPPRLNMQFDKINPSCIDENSGEIISHVNGGVAPYKYYWNDGNQYSLRKKISAGIYILKLEDANKCLLVDTILLEEMKKGNLQVLPKDTVINYGNSIRLNFNFDQIIKKFIWTPSDYLSCIQCLNPLSAPKDEINYILYLTDSDECEYRDTVHISLIYNPKIFIPNTFSPNGDGLNDFLEIFGFEQIQEIEELTIYSRWGEQIYSIKSRTNLISNQSWDGRFQNEFVNPGVFVYHLALTAKDGKRYELNGDITVLR